jgi:hypothetical protein
LYACQFNFSYPVPFYKRRNKGLQPVAEKKGLTILTNYIFYAYRAHAHDTLMRAFCIERMD